MTPCSVRGSFVGVDPVNVGSNCSQKPWLYYVSKWISIFATVFLHRTWWAEVLAHSCFCCKDRKGPYGDAMWNCGHHCHCCEDQASLWHWEGVPSELRWDPRVQSHCRRCTGPHPLWGVSHPAALSIVSCSTKLWQKKSGGMERKTLALRSYFYTLWKTVGNEPGMMTNAFNSSSWQAEAGGSLWIPG